MEDVEACCWAGCSLGMLRATSRNGWRVGGGGGAYRARCFTDDDGDLSDFRREGEVYCIRSDVQLASLHESHRRWGQRGETETKQARS